MSTEDHLECPNCKARCRPDAQFCDNCGAALQGLAVGPEKIDIPRVVEKIKEWIRKYEEQGSPGTVVRAIPRAARAEEGSKDTMAGLILRAAGAKKGSAKPGAEPAGDLTFQQVVDIAGAKEAALPAGTLKKAVKVILGTCASCGVTVEGKPPKDVQAGVDRGEYDNFFDEQEKE